MFAAEYGWGIDEIKRVPLLAARRLARKITERIYRDTVRLINIQTAAITRGLALSLGQHVTPLPRYASPDSDGSGSEPPPSDTDFVSERWW